MRRYDERDMIFARMNYEAGTPEYCDYYSRHPELKEIDDELRERPDLCDRNSPSYDPLDASEVSSNFSLVASLRSLCDGKPSSEKLHVDITTATETIKRIAIDSGAELVAITNMKPEFYYSHRGRHRENYGDEISLRLPFGIVFAVELDGEMIDAAPAMPAMVESSRKYLKAAMIGLTISYFIRGLGYSARNHMDGNYLAVLPIVGAAAGLGLIGRHGLLISSSLGPRMKLGLVTTEMPLKCTPPLEKNLERFCSDCGICSRECPVSAIPGCEGQKANDTPRWKVDHELCYSYWRRNGTDCGICIRVCPFSRGIGFSKLEDHLDGKLKQ